MTYSERFTHKSGNRQRTSDKFPKTSVHKITDGCFSTNVLGLSPVHTVYQQQCPSNIVVSYKLNDSFDNVQCCFDKVERCFDNVACCFDIVAGVEGALSPVHTNNNVEATLSKQQATLLPVASTMLSFWATMSKPFDFVERTKFQHKTRSTLLPFLATKSNVASTLWLVWRGPYAPFCGAFVVVNAD